MDISSAIFDPELGCVAFTVERITYTRTRAGTTDGPGYGLYSSGHTGDDSAAAGGGTGRTVHRNLYGLCVKHRYSREFRTFGERIFNRRRSTQWRRLVSDDLTADGISATGGPRRFAFFYWP